jgi:hypothetical protein
LMEWIMARHRIPIEVQLLKGADRKNPSRFPANVPKSTVQLGERPDELNALELAIWDDIVAAVPANLLTRLDRYLLKSTCRLIAYVDHTSIEELPTGKFNLMVQCLARLGFTPADRAKLGTNEPPAEPNEFDQFN